MCNTCFQKKKEKEKEWEAEIKKKRQREREMGGEGEREEDPESTIPLKISKNKLFPFLVCLAFIFSFQNFSIGITWNLKKNNLRFSVDKNFQQTIRFYKCLLKNKTNFEE